MNYLEIDFNENELRKLYGLVHEDYKQLQSLLKSGELDSEDLQFTELLLEKVSTLIELQADAIARVSIDDSRLSWVRQHKQNIARIAPRKSDS